MTPPARDAFDDWNDPAGKETARVDISGISVELADLPDGLSREMASDYGPFFSEPNGQGRPLRVRVVRAPLDYFVPPGFAPGREIYRMYTALEGPLFRTVSYRLASWVDLARREGVVALAKGERDPAARALENFLRSCVAWLAIEAGGFFLHAASIVRSERCYLFYGPSGAGKSTLAAMSSDGRVISDDLTVVLQERDGLVAAGGPFRGTYTLGAPVVGSFPIAGLYRLRKDTRTFVRRDDGGCFADLLGNLPFVVDQLPTRPDLIDRIRARAARVPLRYLHFRKDESIWPAVESAV